jgi:multiple antibiotic resistance protein
MAAQHPSFINLVFIGIIALFPVVNPVGSAFIISPYFTGLNAAEIRKAVIKIVTYSFLICTVTLFAGHWILYLFGLSVPVIQLGGGIMICKMGWGFLSDEKNSIAISGAGEPENDLAGYNHIAGKLFFPITFPVTIGAGTISVLFTLSAHSESGDHSRYYINILAIFLSIVVICILVYIFYLNTKTIIHFLGANGENIVYRLSAFLIFCVGLQIAVTGIKTLFGF